MEKNRFKVQCSPDGKVAIVTFYTKKGEVKTRKGFAGKLASEWMWNAIMCGAPLSFITKLPSESVTI